MYLAGNIPVRARILCIGMLDIYIFCDICCVGNTPNVL